jgi:polar amino acid transport system ATP-binding protein
MTNGLIVRDAWHSFGETPIIKGLNLTVRGGETLAILGRSGCGKTTLLRGICALVPLQRGEIALQGQTIVMNGKSLFQEWEIRRKINYVAQTPTLLPHLTVLKNISLGLQLIKGLSKSKAISVAESAASELHLSSKLHRFPEELSGGEAQRVQLLRAIVLQPEVLLLDEITANIDPQTTREVIDALWLLRERAQVPQTIIIVTHVIDFAERFADRIAFMSEGVIYEEGRAATFRSSATREATKAFVADVNSN